MPNPAARRAFWIPFVPAQAGAQDSRLRGNERDYALASNNTSSFPRRVFAPGVCTFASLTRNRGVGGAPRDVRVPAGTRGACHLASKTRVNALMTRHTRRLRGALRPMTRQYTGRDNVTISMRDGGSVPIVSQTAIEPMKMSFSLRCARHDDGARGALARAEAGRTGRPVPATRTQGPADATSNGKSPWAGPRAAAIVSAAATKADGFDGRF